MLSALTVPAGTMESRAAWDTLAQEMERMHPSVEKPKLDDGRPLRPGQFRFVRPDAGVWRENYFYTPPMVFIIKRILAVPGAILAAQTYHDIQMAAPGDLILTADDSSLGPLFVECWNTYTLKETLLGPPLDTVPERVVDAVLEYENHPEFCPEWGMLPRPLAENDPRIFFRELELEVAYTFSSQSVSQIMEVFEAPALKLLLQFAGPASGDDLHSSSRNPLEKITAFARRGLCHGRASGGKASPGCGRPNHP